MRAVDTNVLVRLLVRDDSQQVAAAESFVAQGAWVPKLVLAEVAWVLEAVYQRTPMQIAASIEALLNHETLTIQEHEIIQSALSRFRARPSVEFADCLIVEIARKSGHLPLGTFDKSLGKLEGTHQL